jgi:2-iminobutanoate/2-iminopropanoate deaminase
MNIVQTDNAPKAIGPYSQAISSGNLLFCSGQIPLDSVSMTIVGETIEEQTRKVLENLSGVLIAGGSSLKQVLKTTVFLKNMDDFPALNAVYEEMFEGHKPARATVEVSRLPKNVLVEIECVAAIG